MSDLGGMFELGCVRASREGVLIDIRVVPNSKGTTRNFGYDKWDNRLGVRTSAPAVKGKANKEVVGIFSNILGNCHIVSGELSRKKTILVRNLDVGDVVGILNQYLLIESK